ncbi:MAG: GGDEF domain-containing protein [Rhodobacterales bacterium]|nr:MAG: GGDEF domain-containing protein [Rhodobacterales bacterium]
MNIQTPGVSYNGIFDTAMPMHLLVDQHGIVQHTGPTLRKVFRDKPVLGIPVTNLLEVRRPKRTDNILKIAANGGGACFVRLLDEKRLQANGLVVLLPQSQDTLLNLSFGINVIDAAGYYGLTQSDFSPTDLAVEMMYLAAANAAFAAGNMDYSHRLYGRKSAAEIEAMTDTLTGLANRRALETELTRLKQQTTPFSVMHVDLDWFKKVNDTLGHAAGDVVLQTVARKLLDNTRSEDIVARVGGDEFTLVFSRLTDSDTLSSLARRIICALEQPIPFGAEECCISASIGIAIHNSPDAPDIEKLLNNADAALYAAKNAGRAQFRLYSPDQHSSGKEP